MAGKGGYMPIKPENKKLYPKNWKEHNPQNNNPENLRALCQKCHLNYDIEHHKQTRRKTREKGQLKLI